MALVRSLMSRGALWFFALAVLAVVVVIATRLNAVHQTSSSRPALNHVAEPSRRSDQRLSLPTAPRSEYGTSQASLPSRPGYSRAIVRGAVTKWYMFDYPDEWHIEPAGGDHVTMDYHTVADDNSSPSVQLQMLRGRGVTGRREYPDGAVTSTLLVDGRMAVRYDPPLSDGLAEAGVTCYVSVEVPAAVEESPEAQMDDLSLLNELRISLYVYGVNTPAECQPLVDVVFNDLLPTLHFIPDYTIGTSWPEHRFPDVFPDIGPVAIYAPSGWTVAAQPDSVVIQSAGSWLAGSPISIQAVPRQVSAYYSDAEDILGGWDLGLALAAASVQNGLQTTEYADNNDRPVKWNVIAPDLPEGSEEQLRVDQTVWRILLGSAFTYMSVPGYP